MKEEIHVPLSSVVRSVATATLLSGASGSQPAGRCGEKRIYYYNIYVHCKRKKSRQNVNVCVTLVVAAAAAAAMVRAFRTKRIFLTTFSFFEPVRP